jgi:hypothetical protein
MVKLEDQAKFGAYPLDWSSATNDNFGTEDQKLKRGVLNYGAIDYFNDVLAKIIDCVIIRTIALVIRTPTNLDAGKLI